MKKYCFLWLALRLMVKQRLRSVFVFCCMLFSSILLHVFCGLGCYFWKQVHGERSGEALFGSGQAVLMMLAAVLLNLVFSCSAVLLWNIFSLASAQRWKSLGRLLILGASGKDVLFLAAAETGLLTVPAVPAGCGLSLLLGRLPGFRLEVSCWISAGIQIWLAVLSCCCGVLPVWRAVRRPLQLPGAGCPVILECAGKRRLLLKYHKTRNGNQKLHAYFFAAFMSKKYYQAGRRHHRKITFTILAAVLLYVPAADLIEKNLKMDQAVLSEKYGITYTCIPKDQGQLQTAIEECRILKAAAASAGFVSYVRIPGIASIASALLDSDFLSVLKKAGWKEGQELQAASDIYFLEDSCYDKYLQSCSISGQVPSAEGAGFPVLVNRCINRTSYNKDTDYLFRETALLHEDAVKAVYGNAGYLTGIPDPDSGAESAGEAAASGKTKLEDDYRKAAEPAAAGLKIYCGILQEQPDRRTCIYPAVCCDEFPEGIYAGDVTVVLPLSRLAAFCPDIGQYSQGMSVCAFFADTDETLFERLQQELGMGAAGKLRNNRKEYQEWYNSLHEIHLALLAVCGTLFFTALLHVFITMLFHCIQRRHGLAVLWSLGQTRQGLAAVLVLESLRSFLWALLAAVPVSCGLCYYIYRIYRYVWQTAFILPLGQLVRIAGVLAVTAAASAAVSWNRMKRQDFLQEIRDQ